MRWFVLKVVAGNAESWNEMLDANCRSMLNVTGVVMDSLSGSLPSRGGHIINITSEMSSHPYKGLAAYSATKHFIESWSRGLRQELAPLGIRVTNIQPGGVRAELRMHYGAEGDRVFTSCGNPAQTVETPSMSDIAEAVLYAMASRSTFCMKDIAVEPSHPEVHAD